MSQRKQVNLLQAMTFLDGGISCNVHAEKMFPEFPEVKFSRNDVRCPTSCMGMFNAKGQTDF